MFKWEKKIVPSVLWRGGRQRPYWVVTRGFAVASVVTGFYFLLPATNDFLGLASLDSRGYLLATSIFASTLLTFALIAVYRDLGETQTEQTEIQRNQELLMEVQHEPVISVHDLWGEDDVLKAQISNDGNGIATNLSCAVLVEPIFDDQELEWIPASERQLLGTPLVRFQSSNDRNLQPDPSNPTRFESTSDIFVSPVGYEDAREGNIPLPQYADRLSQDGVDQFIMQIRLSFGHLMPTRGNGKWYGGYSIIKVQNQMSLEEAIDEQQNGFLSREKLQSDNYAIQEPGTYYD